MGLYIGNAIQSLVDQQMRNTQASRTPIYMRFRNFAPQQDQLYAQLGFVIAPSSGQTGMSDVQIAPPPSSKLVSMHNIGMSQGKLRFGAREFLISATFINAQQSALGLATPDALWLSSQFVGIVGYGSLWSVEEYSPDEAGAVPVAWLTRCNANELR